MLLRPQFRLSFWFAILISCAAFFSACSSSEKIPDSAEGLFKHAQELEKDERYEEALARYQDVKNKHPYSRFATQSEMAIADIHFRREEYPEAQVAYQTFREFHPKHEQIDYVTSQLGLSYFHQLPSTIDRDLTLAERAINYFDEVLQKYPNSKYAKEAKEKRAESLKMLAEKEAYIADFYFRKAFYDSALSRYENLLAKYKGAGLDARALKGAALSAARSGENDKAKAYYSKLVAEFPSASETADVKRELK